MPRRFSRFSILVAALYTGAAGAAEPGLILRLGGGDARLVRGVNLYVPESHPASPFAEPGPVKAVWEGTLNLEARQRLIFTLEGSGEATLSIDGEVLCEKINTPSEQERISSGEHTFRVEYTGPAKGDTQLRLFWEERGFGKEPVPAKVFTHDPADALLNKQSQLRRGHQLLRDLGCAHCHIETCNTGAPSLVGIGERLDTAWLAHWIADPSNHRPSARMPKLFHGEGAAQKAADIAHYLAPQAEAGAAAKPANKEAITLGGHLFYEQGCVGCHTLDAKGDAERIGLAGAGQKFRPSKLAEFLRAPEQHHADARMPNFGFTEAESSALEAFLRSLDKSDPPPRPPGDPERGEILFKQSGCLNCHAAGDEMKTELPVPKALAELGSADCKAATYPLTGEDKAAIQAALGQAAPQPVPAEAAPHLLAELRCAACHSRDGQPATRDLYEEQVAHLKPPEPPADDEKPGAHKAEIPHLDHLGFKLRPEWREKLFAGGVKPKTRHWLKARMPAFPNRATELSTALSHAVGLPAEEPDFAEPDPAAIKAGAELTGITGFSCGACHGVGDKPAFAVFEGEGPNLKDAGARLRGEYFHLWMNDPLRQWPGTIMPKYATDGQTPLTQHYEGDATKQFGAILDYIRSLSK